MTLDPLAASMKRTYRLTRKTRFCANEALRNKIINTEIGGRSDVLSIV